MGSLEFLQLIGLLLTWLILSVHVATADQPNIVFVLADDYGFRDIGYHESDIATPVLDELAENGVKLENYYVQPLCSPTRQQLLSGRYQIRTGLTHKSIEAGQRSALPLDSPTLADKMKEVGYATHMIGKWHLGFYKNEYLPHHRGFDTFYGFLTGGEDFYTHMHGKKSQYIDLRYNDEIITNATGVYSTNLFSTRAVDIINEHPKDQKPLFLYLAYQAVHSPLQVPSLYSDKFVNISDPDRKIYAGMVNCMEEGIKNVTEALINRGMWDNTVFIFSTDNGGSVSNGASNWPLRGWKGSFWEGGVRGIGFVNSALLGQRGVVSKGLIHVSDWYPTLVHIANGNLNGTQPLDGLNQWNTISQGQASPRTELLHNIDTLNPINGVAAYDGTFNTSITAALRVGDMKIVTGDPGTGNWIPPPDQGLSQIRSRDDSSKNVWLFNITNDPNEMNDLADSQQETVRQLLDRLAEYNSVAVPAFYPDNDPLSNPRNLPGNAFGPWVDD